MELTLKRLLEQAEFNQVRRGGYDRDEVNALLDRAVAMATKVEAKLTETLDQARSGSGPSAAEIEAEVQRRVAASLADRPRERGGPSDEEQTEQVARALLMAQRTADQAVAEARKDADRIRSEAESEAAVARTDLAGRLEAERVRARKRIRTEIAELESVRESMRTDIGLLERHVEEQRNQLRSSVGELQRLLDDPAGFHLAPAPETTDSPEPEHDPSPLIEAASPLPAREAPEAERDEDWTRPISLPAAIDDGPDPEPADPPPGALDFGEVEHVPPGRDPGAPTQAVPVVDSDDDGDADDLFMAELRRAIEDDEPLGPRDHEPTDTDTPAFEPESRGWPFKRN